MKKHAHVWTWPIAGYLFLGGLGAGMTIIATVADLFFGLGYYFIPCALGSLVALGLGSFLLIFELGRPLQFWRVFSREKAILTFGAWMVLVLVVFDVIYLSFWFSFIPWHSLAVARMGAALICFVLGLGVILYTGIELSSMKARPFWSTPALPILFALSGLLAGSAANLLMLSAWPYGWEFGSAQLFMSLTLPLASVQGFLVLLNGALAVLTLISSLLYALLMYFSASSAARQAAHRWLSGSYALAFWGGLVGIGLVVPLLLQATGITLLALVGAACLIFGGICLRFLVVYCDDRRELSGEALYHKRLPQGDELFLTRKWE